MSNPNLQFIDLYWLGAPHTKKCLLKPQGQTLRLRSSKGQKGKKKLVVRNSCLNTNQKDFLEYLSYLWSYTHLSRGILFFGQTVAP